MNQPNRTFRLTCQENHIPYVEDLLTQEGFVFEKEPFYKLARKLVFEPFPLGASLASFFGYIYIQDRSSMLPPLALAPHMKEFTLDMCASPGSKTSLLSQLADKNDFILANEPNSTRRATLIKNLNNCNFLNVGTCSYPGEKLPLQSGSLSAILLDPPCSGWGTTNKHPGIKSLWSGKKIEKLITLQKKLLKKASDLLKPDGHIIYSTCTTNKAENEEQIKYAMDDLGLKLIPLANFEGFKFEELDLTPGALLVNEQQSEGQGFFIAHLRKPGRNTSKEIKYNSEDSISNELINSNQLNNFKTHLKSGLHVAWPAGLSSFLPAGSLEIFGESLYFISCHSDQLPAGFKWKGPLIGKFNSAGSLRINGGLRKIIAPLYKNYKSIHFENITQLKKLLAGQSVPLANSLINVKKLPIDSDPSALMEITGEESSDASLCTLWWKHLPLGLAQIKAGRIIPKFH